MLQDRLDRKRGYFRHPFAPKMFVVLETLRGDTRGTGGLLRSILSFHCQWLRMERALVANTCSNQSKNKQDKSTSTCYSSFLILA